MANAKITLVVAAAGLWVGSACSGNTVFGDGAVADGGTKNTGGSGGSGGAKNTGGSAGSGGVKNTGGSVGSGGVKNTGGSAGSGGATFKTCGAMKVTAGCAMFDQSLRAGVCTTCHDKAGAQAFQTIDFMTDPKGSLVGKFATYGDLGFPVARPACPTAREVLLDPNDFDRSLFVTKLRGTGFACGDRMPLGFALSSKDVGCLLSWACLLSQQ